MSKYVRVGSVRRFDHVEPSKEQALKVVEEAAEVFSAWKDYSRVIPRETDHRRQHVLDECADVIQATINLVAALGVEDFRPCMDACEKRSRDRGRITDGGAE